MAIPYEEGQDARYYGARRLGNPYRCEYQREAWFRGWDDEDKKQKDKTHGIDLGRNPKSAGFGGS